MKPEPPSLLGKGVGGDKSQEEHNPREAPERKLSTSEGVDEVWLRDKGWLRVWMENELLDPLLLPTQPDNG